MPTRFRFNFPPFVLVYEYKGDDMYVWLQKRTDNRKWDAVSALAFLDCGYGINGLSPCRPQVGGLKTDKGLLRISAEKLGRRQPYRRTSYSGEKWSKHS